MNKKTLVLAVSVATLGIGVLSAGNIQAQSETTARDTLTQRIAQKFNLNETEVQTVFSDHREDMQAQRQASLEDRLNTLVSEGKLTQDQKNKLIVKLNEKHEMRDDLRNLSREEMHEKMEQVRVDFETWLEENGIDHDLIRGTGFGNKGPRTGGQRMFQ